MKKSQIILIIIGLVLVGAVVWQTSKYEPKVATWAETDIPCLPGGHANAALHIHPELEIVVDGVKEKIPADIGISSDCMAQVHTHDATGKIHVESDDATKTFALTDFFKVYGESIDRGGYEMEITVNGEINRTPETIILKDHDSIVIEYKKVEIKEVNLPPHSSTPSPSPTSPIACTMEAKLCPDGSAVGRTGPNCEFSPCP